MAGLTDGETDDITEHGVGHWFILSFDNIMHEYRARCECGKDFGLSGYLADLATAFDDHLDETGGAWWRTV